MADEDQKPQNEATGGVVTFIRTQGLVWAIRPDLLDGLSALHGRLVSADAGQLQAARAAQPRASRQASSVAVVPLKGMILPEADDFWSMLFGATGLNGFLNAVKTAVADPDVKAVVMDVDSPGGVVDGVPEAAAQLRAIRDSSGKPLVAVANTQAASAAYWLASQAHEVIASPSSEVGSIGVYQLHRDLSAAMEQMGVKPTLISAGKYKVEGNPYEPLGDEARGAAQQAVDDYYGMFVKDVASGRGVDSQTVQNGYGEGRSLIAKRAQTAGLVDRVATLDQTVQRLSSGRAQVLRRAEDDQEPVQAIEPDPQPEPDLEVTPEPVTVEYSAEDRARLLVLAGL